MTRPASVPFLAGLMAPFILFGCVSPAQQAPVPIESLVSVDWLHENLGEPDVVVLDCSVIVEPTEEGGIRSVSGRSQYELGHIPTAGFADLMGELSDSASSLQFAVPEPEQFVATMQSLGVGDNTRVVLYDSYNSVWAARVWWMLRWAGFDNAAILDGGINAWTAAGHALSDQPSREPVRSLTLNLRPALIADRDEVFESLGRSDVSLVDAMPAAHYRGEFALYDRPGHIPGAKNLPSSSLVDESGLFLSNAELAGLVDGDPNIRSIHYCGGGISASATAFALTRLGYSDVAVYTASLQEWAPDLDNPMDVAPELERLDEE